MLRFKLTVVLVGLLGFVAGTSLASVELSLDADFPEVGKDQAVAVSGDGSEHLRLWVVYSPSSETQVEEEIGPFSGGQITWRPARAGIATLSARDGGGDNVAAVNVAVLFSSTPASGVLVMGLAGVLLFGGAGLALRSVLRTEAPNPAEPEP